MKFRAWAKKSDLLFDLVMIGGGIVFALILLGALSGCQSSTKIKGGESAASSTRTRMSVTTAPAPAVVVPKAGPVVRIKVPAK